jgi:ABC-type lipoprotein release transport system permease subunit
MTCCSLLLKTLLYHWRTNLAVLLGVVAGTAVIGGALIVGDSVRGSLRELTLARLGKVDLALTGPRFIREQLALELNEKSDGRFVAAPAILLQSSLEKRRPGSDAVVSRAGRASLIGLDQRAWDMIGDDNPAPREDEVFLSSRLAHKLEVQAGDEVTLLVELPSDVPRDALLGKRDEPSIEIPLKVRTVPAEDSRPGRFGLLPDQQLPSNAIVALGLLQDKLGLAARRPTRRDPRIAPARINSLVVETVDQVAQRNHAEFVGDDTARAALLNQELAAAWKLEDIHLRIVPNEKFQYLSLESDRMILDRQTASAARNVASQLGCKLSPVLAYIANEISLVGSNKAADPDKNPPYSRYSVVAGLDRAMFTADGEPPFGPFRFLAPDSPPGLADGDIGQTAGSGEIILNDWLAQDLGARVGDDVRLTYHVVGSHGELPEEERRFKVRGIVALEGVAADRGLVPEVHGITDVNSFDEWDAPFPMKKVTPRDEAYWDKYRATPKAFIALAAAQHLWQSRYGDLTSLRVSPIPGKTLDESRALLAAGLLKQLKPADMGLVFQPVKYQGLQAASGTTDFGGLFIGFSFFLILSAMILIGLLFRLGIGRRTANVGLLLATGFSQAQVRTLLLGEGLAIVAAGGIAGVLAAAAYAALIVHGLKTWWIGAIGTRFLELHVGTASLAIGLTISVLAALVAIWWGIRSLWKLSPRGLLSGVTQPLARAHERHRQRRNAFRTGHLLAGIAAAATAAVVTKLIPGSEAFAGFSWPTIVFFLVGLATLAAGLAYLSAWVDSEHGAAVRGMGLAGTARLAARNAARNRSRSMLSAGLIASAAFLIVAIAAGHRNPALETPDKRSGNGGFTLVAESTIPVLYYLNTSAGSSQLGLDDPATSRQIAPMTAAIGFRVNPGENASCLNIYQTRQPTILGVPPEMIERGGFKFIGAVTGNPWETLRQPADDGTIPVFGDMNTLQYSLHVGPGQTLALRGENGETAKVKIAGMLDSSVFQGVLLMDESAFQKMFPSRVGYQYFLIEVPPASSKAVADALESKIPGLDAERVADRLASFLAVQNTYLSTFQALGGLGLLLGTIGLAIVMLRNVLERRSELALLRAVGFREVLLAALVLFENALLLGWGLATGSASALLAMLPHLVSTGADVPWRDVTIIIVAVFVAGMAGALLAVRGALRTPVLATLRAE